MAKILVTGAAGFIGFHVCQRLLKSGHTVVGLDNFNSYYDVRLKRARAAALLKQGGPEVQEIELADTRAVQGLFEKTKPEFVIHLGAQAGVRHSLEAPQLYVDSNVTGTLNILEACRRYPVRHLVFASSSSVYGLNQKVPFSTQDHTDHPISLYAATKKSNELMAHTYAHLFGIPTTGLRFFTVYGPWGRPDMAYFLFTQAISEGRPINVFDAGRMKRDFTYIDDIVEGIVRVMERPAKFRLYNIGNNNPVSLDEFIRAIESAVGKKAIRNEMPVQPGDMIATYADIDDLMDDTGFRPSTPIQEGIGRFVQWYREYHANPVV